MDLINFPNPKLNLPKEIRDSKDNHRVLSFQAIDNYISSVKDFIYTDINLNYQPSDSNHVHAWFQRAFSENILRSLYIRNSFVEAFNSRNTVSIFLSLKAWFEIVGALASLLNILEKKLPREEFVEELKSYVLGNKGEGQMRVGKIDAKSVSHMLRKADKYLSKINLNSNPKEKPDNFFTDFYDMASNPSHPSFDAHEIVGYLEGSVWKVKTPQMVKNSIVTDLPGYGGLLTSPLFILSIAKQILEIESTSFDELKSRKYFD